MTTPCLQEKAIDIIEKRTERIEDKLDTLMDFRSKIVGIQIAVSTIITSMVAFLGWIISIILK
jgi:hypothetical protein